MVVYSMFMDRKTEYYQNVTSSQSDLLIQWNINHNPNKLFCGYWKIDTKIYVEAKEPE